jgi:hypothetical protein
MAPGASLAVAVHLAYCERCARDIGYPGRHLRAPGGGLVVEPAVATLARPVASGPGSDVAAVLPALLRHVPLRPWRWLRPGVRVAELRGVSGLAECSVLLGLPPNVRQPFPRSADLLVLLAGRLRYAGAELRRGDLIEIVEPVANGVTACGRDEALALVVGDDDLFRPAGRRYRPAGS